VNLLWRCLEAFIDSDTIIFHVYYWEVVQWLKLFLKSIYLFFTVFEDPPEFRFETIYYIHCTPFPRKAAGIIGQRGQESKGKVTVLLYYYWKTWQHPDLIYQCCRATLASVFLCCISFGSAGFERASVFKLFFLLYHLPKNLHSCHWLDCGSSPKQMAVPPKHFILLIPSIQ
jgi:hypothetical protein